MARNYGIAAPEFIDHNRVPPEIAPIGAVETRAYWIPVALLTRLDNWRREEFHRHYLTGDSRGKMLVPSVPVIMALDAWLKERGF